MSTDNELRPASRAWQDYQKRRAERHKGLDSFIARHLQQVEEQIQNLQRYRDRTVAKWRHQQHKDDAQDWKRYLEERAAEKSQEVA